MPRNFACIGSQLDMVSEQYVSGLNPHREKGPMPRLIRACASSPDNVPPEDGGVVISWTPIGPLACSAQLVSESWALFLEFNYFLPG